MVDARSRSRVGEALSVAYLEASELIRSVRLLFMVGIYGGTGLVLGYIWLRVDYESEGTLSALARQVAGGSAPATPEEAAMAGFATQLGLWLTSLGYDRSIPLPATGVLHVSLWLLPMLLLFIGYDRVADDRQTRYTRYVLQRVHRESYLVGKICGHATVSWGAVLAVQLVWLALGMAYGLVGLDFVVTYAPSIWLALAVYVLAYSSYTVFVSTAFERPILALLLGTLIMSGVWVATGIASFQRPWMGKLWLSAWSTPLLQLDTDAFVVFGGYAVAFALLGALILRRVDL